jgi:hypothetical protein
MTPRILMFLRGDAILAAYRKRRRGPYVAPPVTPPPPAPGFDSPATEFNDPLEFWHMRRDNKRRAATKKGPKS